MNKSHSTEQMLLLGLTNAVQALAMAVLDDDVKRNKVRRRLDSFAEAMLDSDLSQEQKQSYLSGLALLGAATTFSSNEDDEPLAP